MHRIKRLIIMGLLIAVATAHAQDKPFSRKALMNEIHTNWKSQNYSKVNDLVKDAFKKHPELTTDLELNNIRLNACSQLALAENRKIYLASGADTTKYFGFVYDVYACGMRLDSLEQAAVATNPKQKVKYRANITDRLSFFRNNLSSGGKYYYKKQKLNDAYRFIDTYLTTVRSPYIDYSMVKNSALQSDSVSMAKLAVYSAYGCGAYANVPKYLPLALADTVGRSLLLEVGVKSYQQLHKDDEAVLLMQQGWASFPQREFFYLSLIRHDIENAQYAVAFNVVSQQLKLMPEDGKLWFLRGKIEQCMERPDSAILSYRKSLEYLPDNAETYSGIGNMYLSLAHEHYNTSYEPAGSPHYAEFKKQQRAFYLSACEAFETSRKLDGENKSLWLDGLKEVYYKLNRGKDLKSLEAV